MFLLYTLRSSRENNVRKVNVVSLPEDNLERKSVRKAEAIYSRAEEKHEEEKEQQQEKQTRKNPFQLVVTVKLEEILFL